MKNFPSDFRDYKGDSIELGSKATLITFFRDVDCLECFPRAFELNHHFEKWNEKGLRIILVIDLKVNELKDVDCIDQFRCRIVEDPEKDWYACFGLEKKSFFKKLKNNQFPADFVFDAQGKKLKEYRGQSAYDHLDLDYLEKMIIQA